MFTETVGPDVCGAGGPDAATHPGTSGAGRPLRDGPGEAVPDVAAGGIEAFARAGAGGVDTPPALRARASIETGGEADAKRPAMDRGVSPFLGEEPGSPRRLLKTTANHGEKT